MVNRRRTGSGTDDSANDSRSDDESSQSDNERDAPVTQGNKASTDSNAHEKRNESKRTPRRGEVIKEKKDPLHVPRLGVFFHHDDRDPEQTTGGKQGIDDRGDSHQRRERVQRKKASDDAWTHDKFQDFDDDRKPKSSRTKGSSSNSKAVTTEPRSERREPLTTKIGNTIVIDLRSNPRPPSPPPAKSNNTISSSSKPERVNNSKNHVAASTTGLNVTAPTDSRQHREYNSKDTTHREHRGPPREPYSNGGTSATAAVGHRGSSGGRGDVRDHHRDRDNSEHQSSSAPRQQQNRETRGPPREPREHHQTHSQEQQSYPHQDYQTKQQPQGAQDPPARGNVSPQPRLSANTSAVRSTQERPLRERPNRTNGEGHRLSVANDVNSANKLKNAVGIPSTGVNSGTDYHSGNNRHQQQSHQQSQQPHAQSHQSHVTPTKAPPALDVPQLKATARVFEPTPSPSATSNNNTLFHINSKVVSSLETNNNSNLSSYSSSSQSSSQYAPYTPDVSGVMSYVPNGNINSATKFGKGQQQQQQPVYGGEYGAPIVSPRDSTGYTNQASSYGLPPQDLAIDAYGNAVPVMYNNYHAGAVYADNAYGDTVAYGDGSVVYSDNSGLYADPYGGGIISGNPGTVWYSTPGDLPSGTIYYPPPPPVTSPAGAYYGNSMENNNH